MKRFNKILQNQSGIALITVILIISILVAAAVELNRSSRADVYSAANISDGIRLAYIAKSGFYGAASLLVNSGNSYETLRDDWANAESLSIQSRTFFDNGYFTVRIEDEQGKIPLHKLVQNGVVNPNVKEMLLRLLQEPEFKLNERKTEEIVDAIIDWVDENEQITGLGAESSYYASLSPPYSAKNTPLDCIEELLMVRGVTNELFGGTKEKPALAPLVTIYGTGKININTAPRMVLRALSPDITVELADKMDQYRKLKSSNLSGADWYRRVSGMEGVTIKPELIEVAKSNFFRIYSTGVADKMAQSVSGIVERSPFRIVNWRQD